jgi:Zn-dependent protease
VTESGRVFLIVLPILLVSLTLHELAHAWVAWRLGDPTAKMLGRLTLNPISHIDPIGVGVFVVSYFAFEFPIGWARPVPITPGNFRRPKRDMAIVALAGPLANFVIAYLLLLYAVHAPHGELLTDALAKAFGINVTLGIFNLIPIPPLDGSRVVGALMDDDTYDRWLGLDVYGLVVLFGAMFLFRTTFTSALTELVTDVADVMRKLAF